MLLYCTADKVGEKSGGGLVTHHESEALKSLGPCEVWERNFLDSKWDEPWKWDGFAQAYVAGWEESFQLAHIYSGTFSATVRELQKRGTKTCYTIAAHDREVSRREHELLGIPFNYPHLVEEDLWQRYIEGYRLADVIVCPSLIARKTVREYGPEFEKKRIEVIPHGVDLPPVVAPLPKRFVVGNLGSWGADKGIRYLLEAWKKLNYKDEFLILAGRDSTTPFARQMTSHFGGGNIYLMGPVENPSDFYNSISLLAVPSATEGFGITVGEAMAHARPVIVSEGAGAVDLVPPDMRCPPCDVEALCERIATAKQSWDLEKLGKSCRETVEEYTWNRIRERYVSLWKGLV